VVEGIAEKLKELFEAKEVTLRTIEREINKGE
jgi:hypothetical protein